jgi:hypothetical protein
MLYIKKSNYKKYSTIVLVSDLTCIHRNSVTSRYKKYRPAILLGLRGISDGSRPLRKTKYMPERAFIYLSNPLPPVNKAYSFGEIVLINAPVPTQKIRRATGRNI